MLLQYRLHPEHKFHGPDGTPCGRLTQGLLRSRRVHAAGPARLIGKEANKLDEVQAGLASSLSDVVTEYGRDDGTVLHNLVLPVLNQLSGRELAKHTGTHRRTIDRIRAGQQPRPQLANRLLQLATAHARDDLAVLLPQAAAALAMASPLVVLTAWRAARVTS